MKVASSVSLEVAGILMRVNADVALSPSLARLRTAWGSCAAEAAVRAPDTEIFAFEDAQAGEVLVQAGAWLERGEFASLEGHLAIERALYAELERLLPEASQMIHAGAVMNGEHGFLFVGPSGAGKSSLCLAAVKHGARYLADDILTTNGQEVQGVARAIQFDPQKPDVPFPAWLETAALDFTTYERLVESCDNSAPLFVPGKENTLARAPASSFAAVALERGPETNLQRVSRAEVLGDLVGASFRKAKNVDLGRLLSRGAYRLVWREPNEAWRELVRLFS